MLGDLCLEELLEDPLNDMVQELGVVKQDLLRQLPILPTMRLGHRKNLPV